MGLRISTNIASLAVQRNLKETTGAAQDQLEKLSSGKRITKAADDAAGLAIGTNLRAQTRGINQAARNANDGISLIQTAEGGLSETSNILIRLRELSVQAASDTVGAQERQLLDNEYQQLTTEINRISQSTVFNGTSLLDGKGGGSLDFQVGAFAGEQNIIRFDTGGTDASAASIGVEGSSITEKSSALSSIASVDSALNSISGFRAKLGSIQTRLKSTVNNLETQALNQEAARSVIEDVDVAQATAKLASASIINSAGVTTLAQANAIPNNALRLIN
ncbi:MAG: flagellin [Bdellovibrionales bacterium RIFOXYD12_FULL_39_22]|nr:MAG: flagellin [Bdellovibrionales bacterium RIFOXYB1_FULL_39_21]OFZ45224.1 MAG: flagellin [Bdellovibrionales bacterium RIFOXYC12_FULL_39_17]OFZ45583.1 MAG: flagellin [Bdellovibrionales bacterium RIFOXYC1_FULL_39_130]OFZ77445.1 MAG: flagellin [Bdellovibrionales bacterium RIFOXYD1_FULL_39_84]OFZ91574.1 MAG: flagellin [Bdellovibrionales bacterium RIFOXYD12_FULL_39_22]HLE11967.1 flagellin [Bacteriovoracaceae bacterium]